MVCAFLGDHDGGCVCVGTVNDGHDGRIGNAQTINAPNLQSRVHDSSVVNAHFAGADGVIDGIADTAYPGINFAV